MKRKHLTESDNEIYAKQIETSPETSSASFIPHISHHPCSRFSSPSHLVSLGWIPICAPLNLIEWRWLMRRSATLTKHHRGGQQRLRTSERSSILNHTRAATLSELDQTASQPRKELTKDDLLLAEIRQRQMVNLGQEGWWPGLLLVIPRKGLSLRFRARRRNPPQIFFVCVSSCLLPFLLVSCVYRD